MESTTEDADGIIRGMGEKIDNRIINPAKIIKTILFNTYSFVYIKIKKIYLPAEPNLYSGRRFPFRSI